MAIILNHAQRETCLEQLLGAMDGTESLILINPQWRSPELSQVKTLLGLDLDVPLGGDRLLLPSLDFPAWLIPTGGTSGQIKFTVHTRETLGASVRGFQQFFRLERVNFFCILPLYHVGGLMQVWRSRWSGGRFELGNYGELKRGILPDLEIGDFCLSLVPTQLQVLLEVCPQWLARFRLVLVGGAPPWRSLLETARKYGIRLALTYGMTETASQVVALRPEDFFAGKNCAGQVLPHAKLHLASDGAIAIESASLFLGYYPDHSGVKRFQTDDVGRLDEAGYLHIVGRQSQKIISGGENIYPTEIEAAILETNLVADVAVLGVPDHYWGEAVTAILVLKQGVQLEDVQRAIVDQLSRYKQPKHWLPIEKLPRNAQGKLNRSQLWGLVQSI